MRVQNTFSGRPQWYDRAPASIYSSVNVTLAPAGATQRWTYTVPAGRKAQAELILARVRRVTVATTAGNAEAYQQWPSSTIAVIAEIDTNAVGDKDNRNFAANSVLVAGEQIQGFTIDVSTGGTVGYTNTTKLTEFDA